jgi:hypothetical protein
MAGQFCLRFRLPRKSQGFFTCRNSATWGKRFTSLPKEGMLRISSPEKNPTVSTEFEPANSGNRGRNSPEEHSLNYEIGSKYKAADAVTLIIYIIQKLFVITLYVVFF